MKVIWSRIKFSWYNSTPNTEFEDTKEKEKEEHENLRRAGNVKWSGNSGEQGEDAAEENSGDDDSRSDRWLAFISCQQ